VRQASDDPRTRAYRRRRARDTARWRSRVRRRVQLFKIEAGADEYNLAIEFGGLRDDQVSDKDAVAAALGRLLRRGLVALLDQKHRQRRK
jgi:hypothetical protein